jgi:hypothetical protein
MQMLVPVLIMIIILLEVPFYSIFASSPPFSVQGIYLRHNDWLINLDYPLTVRNITQCRAGQQHIPFPNIQAVSYYSDGKSLFATMWLSSQFKEINSTSEIHRSYASFIVPDSVYNVTNQSYETTIDWDRQNRSWTEKFHIWSPIAGFDKILSQEKNYTGFYERGKNYVDLHLDLGAIGYPSEYSVVSYATETFITKGNRLCSLIYITDLVHVPPPKFVISILPSSKTLRQGDMDKIELELKSNTTLSLVALLSTDSIEGIESSIVPREISVSPFGMATSTLQLKVLNNATIQTHRLRINAEISIPIKVTSHVSGKILGSPLPVGTILKNTDFIITVQPPLSFGDRLNNFYNTTLSPISGIWTFLLGVAGVTAPLIIRAYKKQNKRKNKKLSDWFNVGK